MIQKTIGNLLQLEAETGYVHKTGTDIYAKKVIMMPSDTTDMYEEVADKPAYTKDDYDAKVAELVRRKYTEAEEFALQRQMLNMMLSPETLNIYENYIHISHKYVEYNNYVQECKNNAKIILTNKT